MGGTNYSDVAYRNLSSSFKGKSDDEVFKNNVTKSISPDMDPKGIKIRESRDSEVHPESLAIAVFMDETGSMGQIPSMMVREDLHKVMQTLIDHDIKDAHVLFGGIGDHLADRHPLQVGQFEAGADELVKWLTELYLEGNGGGQNKESYLLAWLFAARHTSIDCFEKRKQKGILFTIGDEKSWDTVDGDYLKKLMGYAECSDITDVEILEEVKKMYHVFHIHCNETSYKDDPDVLDYWNKMLPERVIKLEDHRNVAEVIAATVAMIHGVDLAKVTAGFDAKSADTVSKALANVNTSVEQVDDNSGGAVEV